MSGNTVNMSDQEQNVITFENTGRIVVSALAYPLENAKTLIQVRPLTYPICLGLWLVFK